MWFEYLQSRTRVTHVWYILSAKLLQNNNKYLLLLERLVIGV